MLEACNNAKQFVNQLFDGLGLKLSATAQESLNGCLLEFEGPDSELLLSAGGELIEAVQHVVTQAFYRQLGPGQRIICDVDNYRATREAELKAMARHAADRVRASGLAFTFGPMMPSERRIIHLALADEDDLLTESVGDGTTRRLKVSPRAESKS